MASRSRAHFAQSSCARLVASDNVILSEHLERIDLVGLDFINEILYLFCCELKRFVGEAKLLVSDSHISP
jgi:hypothetical protein